MDYFLDFKPEQVAQQTVAIFPGVIFLPWCKGFPQIA
jgi:hypothetical protein